MKKSKYSASLATTLLQKFTANLVDLFRLRCTFQTTRAERTKLTSNQTRRSSIVR